MIDEVEQVKGFSDGWDSLGKGGKEKVIPPPCSTSAAILNIFHRNPNKNDTSDLPFTFSEES